MKERLTNQAKRVIPDKLHKRYERAIAKRSLVELVKLKCIDCCGWDVFEPSQCTVESCPLWMIRLFPESKRGKKNE